MYHSYTYPEVYFVNKNLSTIKNVSSMPLHKNMKCKICSQWIKVDWIHYYLNLCNQINIGLRYIPWAIIYIARVNCWTRIPNYSDKNSLIEEKEFKSELIHSNSICGVPVMSLPLF